MGMAEALNTMSGREILLQPPWTQATCGPKTVLITSISLRYFVLREINRHSTQRDYMTKQTAPNNPSVLAGCLNNSSLKSFLFCYNVTGFHTADFNLLL